MAKRLHLCGGCLHEAVVTDTQGFQVLHSHREAQKPPAGVNDLLCGVWANTEQGNQVEHHLAG